MYFKSINTDQLWTNLISTRGFCGATTYFTNPYKDTFLYIRIQSKNEQTLVFWLFILIIAFSWSDNANIL